MRFEMLSYPKPLIERAAGTLDKSERETRATFTTGSIVPQIPVRGYQMIQTISGPRDDGRRNRARPGSRPHPHGRPGRPRVMAQAAVT